MCTNKKNHTHRNFIHVILICWSNTARAELYYLFVPFVRLPCKREVIHLYAPLTTSSNCETLCTAFYASTLNFKYMPSMCEVHKKFSRWFWKISIDGETCTKPRVIIPKSINTMSVCQIGLARDCISSKCTKNTHTVNTLIMLPKWKLFGQAW